MVKKLFKEVMHVKNKMEIIHMYLFIQFLQYVIYLIMINAGITSLCMLNFVIQ